MFRKFFAPVAPLLTALALIGMLLSPVLAQQGIQYPPGSVFGNDTAAQRPGKATTPAKLGLVTTLTLEKFGGGTGVADNTAAYTSAIGSVSGNAVIVFGTGSYNFAGPQPIIAKSNVWLQCVPGATVLQFNPTGASTFLSWGNGVNQVSGGGIKNCAIYSPDVTFTKTMLETFDTSRFILENVTITGAGASSNVTGGAGSIGWRTHGREFNRMVGSNSISADIPIRLSMNPNSYIATDLFNFDGAFLIGGASNPVILADPGVPWSNTSLINQSWNLGTHGLYWNDTSAVNAVSTINAAGTGYASGDFIVLAGGTCSTAIRVKVLTVSTGVITSAAIDNPGVCSVVPTMPASQLSTTGSGTGATFTAVNVVSAQLTISGRTEQGPSATSNSVYLSASSRLDNLHVSDMQLDGARKGILIHNVKAASFINNTYVPAGATEVINADATNGTMLLWQNEFWTGATTSIGMAQNFQTSLSGNMAMPSLAFYSSSGGTGTLFNAIQPTTILQTGATSGFATVVPQAVAGTPTINWPTVSGTLASSASGCVSLNAVTGAITATGCTPGGSAGGSLAGTYPNPTVAINANLTGDTTSVGNATTTTKINGVDQTTAWSAFTASPSCNTGAGTWTTNTAKSKQLGKTVFWEIDATITAIGTCTGSAWKFNLPSTAVSGAGGAGGETAINGAYVICVNTAASAVETCTTGATLVVNERFVASGHYEGP